MYVQRSYSPELFDDAIGRMIRAQIKTAIDIERFKDLQRRVQKIVDDNRQREQDWGDIPDEFRGNALDNYCKTLDCVHRAVCYEARPFLTAPLKFM